MTPQEQQTAILEDALDRAHDLIQSLRRTLDHDEGGLPFIVSHPVDARCHYVRHESGIGMVPVCHCELQATIDECIAVEKELAELSERVVREAQRDPK